MRKEGLSLKTYSPDHMKALILERKQALKKTDRELAKVLKVSPRTLSRMMAQHTDDWRLKDIRKLCWMLGVTKEQFASVITKGG